MFVWRLTRQVAWGNSSELALASIHGGHVVERGVEAGQVVV
jgi:hypothetical protein